MHTLFIVILVDCAYIIYIYMDCVKDEKGPLSLYNVSQMNIGTVSKAALRKLLRDGLFCAHIYIYTILK